jgi:hypothetical protein
MVGNEEIDSLVQWSENELSLRNTPMRDVQPPNPIYLLITFFPYLHYLIPVKQ